MEPNASKNGTKKAHTKASTSVSTSKAKYIVARRILMGTTFSTMIAGIPLIGIGFWLAYHIVCYRFLEVPIIFIGIALCVCGIVGMVGAFRRQALMLWLYMVLVFFLILLLFAFTVFTFFVVNGGGGHQVNKALFLEYRLKDYSLWFQGQMGNQDKWKGIKSCLQEGHVCARLNQLYPSEDDFYTAPLSPIQSGCCKPPAACKFTFVSPTDWENTTRGQATPDCGRWDNNLSLLCFQCSSCRAGLLQTVKEAWTLVAEVCLLPDLIFLVLAYSIGWLAFLKGLWDDIFSPSPTNSSLLRNFDQHPPQTQLHPA